MKNNNALTPSRPHSASKRTRAKRIQPSPSRPSVACELIVANAGGEIMTGDEALQWLAKSKAAEPRPTSQAQLPQAVVGWLAQRSEATPSRLQFHELDQRLVVTLCRCASSPCVLLVQETPVPTEPTTANLRRLGLSPRQAEVMHWVCEGKTNPEIATILGVTTHTVNRQMEHIRRKLHVDNRQQAVRAVTERLRERASE